MRNSIAKLIHKYSTTQEGYDVTESYISHSRSLNLKELSNLKDHKKNKLIKVKSKQKFSKGNLIEQNLKKLWNTTPTPQKSKLKDLMYSTLKEREIHYAV